MHDVPKKIVFFIFFSKANLSNEFWISIFSKKKSTRSHTGVVSRLSWLSRCLPREDEGKREVEEEEAGLRLWA